MKKPEGQDFKASSENKNQSKLKNSKNTLVVNEKRMKNWN